LFTKEHKDIAHFRSLVSCFLSPRDLLPPGSMGGADTNDTRRVLQLAEASGDGDFPDFPASSGLEPVAQNTSGICDAPLGTSTYPCTSATSTDTGIHSGTSSGTTSTLSPVRTLREAK
jgi:hypothetical protein